jgi:hypothetical protein
VKGRSNKSAINEKLEYDFMLFAASFLSNITLSVAILKDFILEIRDLPNVLSTIVLIAMMNFQLFKILAVDYTGN